MAPRAYGQDVLPFDVENESELPPAPPSSASTASTPPTFIIEGEDGSIDAFRLMRRGRSRRHIRYFEIPAADHFSIRRPTLNSSPKPSSPTPAPPPNSSSPPPCSKPP